MMIFAAALVLAGGNGLAQSPQDILRMLERNPGLVPDVGSIVIPGMPSVPGIPAAPGDVLRIQSLLDRAGYDVGRPDGVLGPTTLRAAARFQQSLGHPPTGMLTTEEISILEMRAGAAAPSQSVPVDHGMVQSLLQRAGYNPGGVDGRWGPRSQQALEAFRRSTGSAAFGPPSQSDLAALQAALAPPSGPAAPAAGSRIDFTTEGPGGQTLTALPVTDRQAVLGVAWTGPSGDQYWLAVIEPGAMPTPGIPAWPRGEVSPTRIEAPAEPGLYEIAVIDVRSGTVVMRRPLEVR